LCSKLDLAGFISSFGIHHNQQFHASVEYQVLRIQGVGLYDSIPMAKMVFHG